MLVLCGGPDITVAGVRQHLSPPTRRQSTLALAYLVLEGRPVPADELADAVWPAGPPKSWASGLRLAISDLRRWLRDAGVDGEVRSGHGAYSLVLPADVPTDVAVVRSQHQATPVLRAEDAVAHLGRVVGLLDAPLLPGHDAPWLERWRRVLEGELLQALDGLSDAQRQVGQADAAVATAERAIALDPLRESSYRLAMAAHRQAGRIGSALRTYERCRRTLADELGTVPSPPTVTAYHALLELPIGGTPVVPVAAEPSAAALAAAAAMTRLHSRQDIATLEARLATIDASPAPDPRERVDTLIELGRARWALEGSTEALRRISLAAGEAALSLRLPDQLGHALELASTTTGIGQQDPDAADLCRRAALAFPEHAAVQIRVRLLEAELVFGDESIALAQQAVDDARRLGDERLLLDALLVLDQSLAWVPDLDRRLAVEAECDGLLARVPPGFRQRPTFEPMTRLQAGDGAWLGQVRAQDPAALTGAAWEQRVYLIGLRGVAAMLDGELEEAQRVGSDLLRESSAEVNTTHAAGGVLLVLARDMGGIAELVPALDAIVTSNPRIAAFRAALALGRALTGDREGAVAVIDAQAAAGFDAVAHDHVYLTYLGLLAEAVAHLDLTEHVDALLALLAPYAGQLCVGAHGLVVLNAMDSYRGRLAAVTGDERGPAWFAAGAALEDRIGAVLLKARTEAWWGDWLRRHGGPAAREEADRLFAGAREVAAAPDRAGLRALVDHLAG